ncbi:MAG TPA: peptidylprolyl isomerase [Alphaproteobacteria bacterium]|jgi:peptidyl-prolyl cis-trans isomerase C
MSLAFLRAAAVAAALALSGAFAEGAVAEATKPADPVVAKVAGEDIHLSDLEAAKQQLPDQLRAMPTALIYQPLLERVIDGKLLAAASRKANLADDAEVKKRMAELQERVMQDVYLEREINARITDEAIQKRYEAYIKDHKAEEQVRARHILVRTREEAETIIKEIGKGGDFAEIAKARSIDPARAQGGDLGFFGRGEMVPEFAVEAFKLQPGAYTKEPVKTQFGWHIIKVEERRTKPAPALGEVREELVQAMTNEAFNEVMAGLKKGVAIERFTIDGKPLPEGGAKPAPKE